MELQGMHDGAYMELQGIHDRMHTPRATPDSKAPRRLGTSTNRFLIVCSTNQILCSVQQTRQAHRPVGSVQILDAQLGCPCVCVCFRTAQACVVR